jgi:hypothetical protein
VAPPSGPHRQHCGHRPADDQRCQHGVRQLVDLVCVIDDQQGAASGLVSAQCLPGRVEHRAAIQVAVGPGRRGDVRGQQMRQRGQRNAACLGVAGGTSHGHTRCLEMGHELIG